MTQSIRWLACTGLFTFVLFVAGCSPSGPKLVPVTGKVSVNGKPARSAIVFMHRKGKSDMLEPTPFATATDDGSFAIAWEPGREGAMPGDYVVTVIWPDMTKEPDGSGGRPDVLRGGFDKIPTSKLTATVKTEPTVLAPIELTLSSAQAAKPALKDPTNK